MSNHTQPTPPLPPVSPVKDSNRFNMFEKNYWQYYLSLEQELLATRKYVNFDLKNNGKTYSLEYLKIYQAVCSEIDVVGKELARAVNPSLREGDIKEILKWWYQIQSSYVIPDENGNEIPLEKRTVTFADGSELCPWKDACAECAQDKNGRKYPRWKQEPKKRYGSPKWWTAYNKVKHHRMSETERGGERILNYTQANLENISNAFAALYILEYSYLSAVGNELDIKSRDYGQLFEQKPKLFLTTVNTIEDTVRNTAENFALAASSEPPGSVQL